MLRPSLSRVVAALRPFSNPSIGQAEAVSSSHSSPSSSSQPAKPAEEQTSRRPKDYQRSLWRLPRSPFTVIPQAWLSTLHSIEDEKLSIIDLHPSIFRVTPRMDLLHRNITWQSMYRNVQLTKQLSKAEMPGGGAKPWPQKKTGRHHAGSIRAPHFHRGGFANGVRGPRTWFYMLPDAIRIQGLCVALTVKHAQSDLVVVDSLSSVPETADASFLQDMAEQRNWGYSVLFVDSDAEAVHGGILEATATLSSFNVMPLFGLNCFSLLKYDTIVMSLPAVELLEKRLLRQMHRAEKLNKKFRYLDFKDKLLEPMEEDKKTEHPVYPPFI